MGRFIMNGNAVMINSKFVEYNNGILSFQVSGTHFPYSNYEPPNSNTANFNNSAFSFTSSESNKATIDYGDGNIISYEFKSNALIFSPSIPLGNSLIQPIHTYTDGNSDDRIIRISFAKPDKILILSTIYVNLYGVFPSEISNLINLRRIYVNQSLLNTFPVSIANLNSLKDLTLSSIGTAISNRIPDQFLTMNLEVFDISNSIDLSNIFTSNLINLFNSPNKNSLNILYIDNCKMFEVPSNISNLINLKRLRIGSTNQFETMPTQLNTIPSLEQLNIGASFATAPFIKFWSSVSNLVNLAVLQCSIAVNMTTSLPIGLENCIKIKELDFRSTYQTQMRIDNFVTNIYNFINTNASKTGSNTSPFRGVTIRIEAVGSFNSSTPTGLYQQPSGFVLGSNNGTPASPKEMIWILVNQYGHTVIYTP